MGKLVLLRHGNSVWNKKNIFTGWVDVSLSHQGVEEAIAAGKKMAGLTFDAIFTSNLSRAQMTMQLAMLENGAGKTIYLHHEDARYSKGIENDDTLVAYVSKSLNERYYGDLQGEEKNAFKAKVGEELFRKYRRSFDTPPPSGESLAMTIERTLPYFEEHILPLVQEGKTVLVVAHGNSLRGIVKEVMNVSDSDIVGYEIATGEPLVFDFVDGSFVQGGL
ncbi:2,3-bisphosphoglycerate-dependent phosphoglycerate mutase [bacterium]|nr:2,3-bisphosphoglycerate-dependent phosphoglycerate mutase [bacterium]